MILDAPDMPVALAPCDLACAFLAGGRGFSERLTRILMLAVVARAAPEL